MAELDQTEPFGGLARDAVAAAAIGFAFAGPPGAAAAALTPYAKRLTALAEQELRSRQTRAEAMWVVANSRSGRTDKLIDSAESGAARLALVATASAAAAESRYPQKIVMLGRALAEGLLATDDDKVDEQQQIVDTVAVLERPHIQLLSRFVNIEGTRHTPTFVRRTVAWQDLAALQSQRRVLPRLLAHLEREGLVHRETASQPASLDGRPADHDHQGSTWRITDFGHYLLGELWDAGSQDIVTDANAL